MISEIITAMKIRIYGSAIDNLVIFVPIRYKTILSRIKRRSKTASVLQPSVIRAPINRAIAWCRKH